jgi:hypothetical protein
MPKNQHMGMGNLVPTNYGYSVQPQVSMIGVNPSVTEKLDQLQATQRSPLSISSGYRSKAYNAKVGGARGSQHIRGNAIDIDTRNMSREEVKSLISEASRLGFTGIGVYDTASNQSIHLDVAGRRAWGPSYGAASVPGWAKDVIGAHLENKYQGTSPAPMVAKVERAQLPAVGPVLETKPSQMAMAPQSVPTPTERTAFSPGGVLSPAKIDVSQLSPVSSAQAAPAQASPAPSMAQSPARAIESMPSPDRFGTTTPNINEANALKSALEAQAAQISAPEAPQNVSAISSLRSLAPAVEAQQQTQAPAPSSFANYSPTPASYQSPAFSTAQPKIDAFGQPPAPGLQQVAQTQAPQQAMAPALAAPTRTISTPQVASVPEQPTIDAPAPDPSLDYFPDKPSTGLLSGMFGPQTATGTIGGLLGSVVGGAALGPLGGLAGGLLGKSMANKFGGGLLGSYNGPTRDIGSGLAAVSSVLGGGMAPGSTATASNGQTVTSLPGGGIQRTSKKYGWTEITTADGRTTRAKSTRGAGGNYGGVKSEKARDAIDKGTAGLF